MLWMDVETMAGDAKSAITQTTHPRRAVSCAELQRKVGSKASTVKKIGG